MLDKPEAGNLDDETLMDRMTEMDCATECVMPNSEERHLVTSAESNDLD